MVSVFCIIIMIINSAAAVASAAFAAANDDESIGVACIEAVEAVASQQKSDDVEREKALEVFKFIDKNGDGCISESEMKEACYSFKIYNKEQIEDAMKDIGKEGMDFEKFYKFLLENKKPSAEVEDEMKKAFKKFDKDGNGTIEKWELKEVLQMGQDPLSDEDIEKLFKEVDKNGDGVIDYEEFVAMVSGTE